MSATATALDVIEGRATWALLFGDCLAPDGLPSLPDRSVAHVITDPPYSEHTHDKSRGNDLAFMVGNRKRLDPFDFACITDAQRAAVASETARIATRWTVIWTDAEGLRPWADAVVAAGLDHVRAGAWVKGNPCPQFSGDRPGTGIELCEIAHRKGRKRWNGGGKVAVWTCNVVNAAKVERVHSAQKPLELMEAVIADFTDPNEIICDPFAGSGTTALACLRLGRRFIGWERDPQHHATAIRRLTGDEVRPVPGQLAMFGAAQ